MGRCTYNFFWDVFFSETCCQQLPHRPAFSAFYTAYREGLKEGAPLHSRGAASVFSILERDEFEKDPGAIQALLRSNKVVVVRALGDYQTPNFHDECKSAFDNKGFIEVQGKSADPLNLAYCANLVPLQTSPRRSLRQSGTDMRPRTSSCKSRRRKSNLENP